MQQQHEVLQTAMEMVVDQINSEPAQLDKDVGTINSWVNCHRAEIDEN